MKHIIGKYLKPILNHLIAMARGNIKSRRDVLGKVGSAFGATIISSNAFASSAAGNTGDGAEHTTVKELTGADSREAIANALSNDENTLLTKDLIRRGFRPRINDAVALKSVYEDDTWITIRIPFRIGDETRSAFVLQSTREGSNPQATIVERHTDGGEQWTTIRTLAAVDGEVKQVDQWSDKESDGPTTQGPPSLCPTHDKCPDPGCIASLAEAYAEEIVACGFCVGTSGWLTAYCLVCAATIIDGEFPYGCAVCTESACPDPEL